MRAKYVYSELISLFTCDNVWYGATWSQVVEESMQCVQLCIKKEVIGSHIRRDKNGRMI